ncbi:MAG TPA: sugar phosphate isomerase/epimerase [Chloroflexia bacterium]|nr:sugar phosphate isomerase/epimerase [Chloroflexia bacterium]
MRADQIGVQLYTLRDLTAADMIGTLRRLAEIGYRAVEFAGFGNSSPQAIKPVLDALGMQAIAAHIGIADWEQAPARVFGDLHTLGAQYAVVPSVAPEDRTPEQMGPLLEKLARWGEASRAAGIRLAYHNHDFEFATGAGGTFYEALLAQTDPDLVQLELDVYWVQYAGFDPVEILRANPGRVPLLHVKDMAPSGKDMAVAGEGILPWDRILGAADAGGTEWFIVEHDRPVDALRDVERALRYLEGRL